MFDNHCGPKPEKTSVHSMAPPSIHRGSDNEEGGLHRPLLAPVEYSGAKQEKLCIDEMLTRHCGEFGRWQMKHFVLTCLAWALEALHTMVMIFADREPAWRCLEDSGGGCPVGASNVCELQPGSWEWVGGQGSSTISEFGLLCGQKFKVGLVQAMFFGGCMIGAGVFGHLSDSKIGRKGALTVACLSNTIFGCLTAFAPNYWVYVTLRVLTGLSTGGTGLCAFVLATEPTGPSKRGVAGMSTFYFFSGGIAALSGIAYIFQSWRSLYIASSIPSLLFLVLVIPFLSESPRWCLIKGKTDQAMKVMREIAKSNGKHLPENVLLALDEEVDDNSAKFDYNNKSGEAITGSVIDVLRVPLTRIRLLLSVAIHLTCAIVYYGLSLNVVNLGTNLYLNVLFNSLAEMPAYFLTAIMLDRLGRKPLAIGTQWLSGIFCIIACFIPGYGVWKVVRMICGIVGIFGMAATYNLLFIFTMELFPTVVRNAALGCASQAAQMGAIFAPFVVVLGEIIPFGVFGVCGIVGGLLVLYLPETLNKPLYDTMAGMESGERTSPDV